jgi:hypothetical protein
LDDALPDATTWSRFQIDLTEAGPVEAILQTSNEQLEQRGP